MSSDIQYSTSRVSFNKSKINLNNFVREFVITSKDEDYKEKMNFCNIETKTNFHIEKGDIKEFFDLIEKCRLEGVNLNFTEYQKKGCLENKIGSGVFLDFDLYFINKKKLNISFQDLVLEILNEFKVVLEFGLNDFNEFDEIDEISGMFAYKQFYVAYAIILGKKEPEYDQKTDTYKNGFHILFPNILLTRSVKKYLLCRLSENKIIRKIIVSTGTTSTDNYLDKNSSNVPHVLFGSSKTGKIPYCLIDAYKTYIKKKVIDIPSSIIEILSSKTINTERGQIKLNLIKEFNLNYAGDLIRFKQYIPPKKTILDKINLRDEQLPDNNSDDVEKYIDDLENEISILSMNIPEIKYIKGMLEILSIKRLSEYDTWRNVIYVLANCGEKYNKLAHWVSSRVHEKYNPNDLDVLWNKAINEPSSRKTLSRKSLYFWALEDNPDDLKKIIENTSFNQINADIHCKISEGNLNHCEFAKYIFIMFREKYITDKVSPTKIAWYEFVTEEDACSPGEIYKWKELIFIPKTLNTFISEKLKLIIAENITELENKIKSNDAEDDDAGNEIKYYNKLIKNVKKSAQKLSCVNFKTNVFKELQVKFQQDYFTQKLNMDPNIIGVGNGILVLDDLKKYGNSKVPKLIKGFHEYKISKFTPIAYEPYNPESTYVQKIEKLISDLFPEHEHDAKEFIMYYLASSLDFHPKESLLLICSGNGCHSIDTPILMHDGTVKIVQNVQIDDKLMGDDGTARAVQKLYRGIDKMVKIMPKKEESFIVNMDHVLSLKFTNTIAITQRKESGSYRLYWHELNGSDEPKRKSKTLKTRELAENYKNEMILGNKNIIKKNDVIDIKVKDLLKWNSWWLDRGNVYLYKNNRISFEEKNLNIDPYLLGHWLGDGTSSGSLFTTMDEVVVSEYKNKLKNCEIVVAGIKGKAKTYRVNRGANSKKNEFLDGLRSNNLINNKHIPHNFKTSSINQRLELLAGIIDSDGHYQVKMKQYELTLKNEKLTDDCVYLCRSLGFACYKKQVVKTCNYVKNDKMVNFSGIYYRIQIYGDEIYKIPCRINKKMAEKRSKNKNALSDSFKIEIMDDDKYYGFELDGNHRYTTGDFFIHHNSNGKSFLMDFLNNVLGEHYSTKISMDFFTGGRVKSSQADPEAMNLIGKRFAYSSESSPDDKMNVEKVKEYTGHERMSIRGLYRDTITTRLHCNFTIITNFKPIIETTDHGSLRRFLFYEFKYKFVEHEPTNEFEKKMDKKVSNVYKEDKNYQQAFLSIMVKYYIDLHEKYDGDIKKVAHPTILNETRNYINTLDHISKFLSIHVVFNESENNTMHSIITLVEKYKSWYETHIGKFTKPNSYIISSFCNSAIKNKIVKNKKGEDVYFGIRILDSGEELREGDIPLK